MFICCGFCCGLFGVLLFVCVSCCCCYFFFQTLYDQQKIICFILLKKPKPTTQKYFKKSEPPMKFSCTKRFLHSMALFSIFLRRVGYKTEILYVYNLLILKCQKRKCDSSGYFAVRSTSFPAVLYRSFFYFVGFICLF